MQMPTPVIIEAFRTEIEIRALLAMKSRIFNWIHFTYIALVTWKTIWFLRIWRFACFTYISLRKSGVIWSWVSCCIDCLNHRFVLFYIIEKIWSSISGFPCWGCFKIYCIFFLLFILFIGLSVIIWFWEFAF